MSTKKFSKGEAIRFGWNTMKNNLGFFVGLLILASSIIIILGILEALTVKGAPGFSFLLYVASVVLQLIMEIGLIKIALKFADSTKAEIGDLFSCYSLFFKYLGASILYGLIILGGIILLIIPAFIWGIKFQFFGYFIVEKGAGPIEALKRSSSITMGAKWDLFLFGLLILGINLLGFLALLIGLFATIPTSMVAIAYVYRKLLAQAEVAAVA
jgi:uncharacterized membrane protein